MKLNPQETHQGAAVILAPAWKYLSDKLTFSNFLASRLTFKQKGFALRYLALKMVSRFLTVKVKSI